MNLSTIVKEFSLPLTRPERNLVSRIDADTSALSEDRYEKLFKELAAAREVTAQLPDRQTTERQTRLEKANRLKERLKQLRQMIPFLSPSAAKALKAEMKQIAAQLASLDSEGGGGSGSSMISLEAPSVTAPVSGNPAGTGQNAAQSGETGQGSERAQQLQPGASENELFGREVKSNSTLEERQLKESIEELKKLYSTVLAALKRKLRLDRVQGHLPQHAPLLRIYADWRDSTNGVTVKV